MLRTLGKAAVAVSILGLLASPVLADQMNPTNSSSSTLDQLKEQRKELGDKIKAEREKEKTDRMAASAAKQEALRVCLAPAVDKREAAVGAAFDTYAAAMKTVLSTRRASLSAAWAMTDRTARLAAIRAAWKASRDGASSARKALNMARKSAWTTFYADRKACGSGASSEAPENSGQDNQL